MAKNKSDKTPHYEVLFIVSNKFSEDEAKDVVKTAHKLITDNSGTITYTEEWGKKKLSYQIKSFHYGYYFFAEFDCTSDKVNKINNDFRLDPDILRHIIVVSTPKSAEEIKAEKHKVEQKIIEKAKQDKQEKEELEKKPVKEVDLKDLDEKLDRILETDDLL